MDSSVNGDDYISLMDLARHKSDEPNAVIVNWISVEFELYIVKEFQRLKNEEQRLLGWSAKRGLSKINYRIHTDAIKQNLIPAEVTSVQASIIYANETEVLNGCNNGGEKTKNNAPKGTLFCMVRLGLLQIEI